MMLALYIGLLVFALNGLLFLGICRKQKELAQQEERLRRLYMRQKIRRIK